MTLHLGDTIQAIRNEIANLDKLIADSYVTVAKTKAMRKQAAKVLKNLESIYGAGDRKGLGVGYQCPYCTFVAMSAAGRGIHVTTKHRDKRVKEREE